MANACVSRGSTDIAAAALSQPTSAAEPSRVSTTSACSARESDVGGADP